MQMFRTNLAQVEIRGGHSLQIWKQEIGHVQTEQKFLQGFWSMVTY